MKETLDPDSRDELIKYRIERAESVLEEAAYNASGGYFNTAVNRLYYAAYYSASALLLHYSLEANTHSGIKTMLGLKFIKPGLLDVEYGRIYQQLFECRQSGDYDDFTFYDSVFFETMFPLAEKFVDKMKTMLQK